MLPYYFAAAYAAISFRQRLSPILFIYADYAAADYAIDISFVRHASAQPRQR